MSGDWRPAWGIPRSTVACAILAVISACGIRSRELRWGAGSATIVGSLRVPPGPGPFPAVIFVPGSGSLGRRSPMLRAHARHLVQAGFAVLTYDKRGVGSSSGDWRDESLADYALDVTGGIEALRAEEGIDRERVGIIGHSQGGWVGPMAAERAGGIAFMILVSATPLTPQQQSLFASVPSLHGYSVAEREAAMRLLMRIYEVYRADSGWAETRRAIDSARSEPWFDGNMHALQPDTSWNWRWLHRLPFDYDVTPLLRAQTMPLLTINGASDPLTPADSSRALFEAAARASGRAVTAMVVPGNHALASEGRREPDEAYWRLVGSWLERNAGGSARR